MNTIEACVVFNYNSYFMMDLPANLTIRKLYRSLPLCVGKSTDDLLYLVCDGKIISDSELDKPLRLFNFLGRRCTIHMIFKIPDGSYKYTYNDLIPSLIAMEEAPSNSVISSSSNIADITTDMATRLLNEVMYYGVRIVSLHPGEINTVTEECSLTEDNENCSICNDVMSTDLLRLRGCRHTFHKSCITDWLTSFSVLCPMCNIDTRELL